MMQLVHVDVREKEGATFTFQGCDAETAAKALDTFFVERGYRLEEGTTMMGSYGIGSKVAAILLGAMVRRFRFDLNKGMTGFSGGLIGISRMKKELAQLTADLHKLPTYDV
jgi:hypothetical protein